VVQSDTPAEHIFCLHLNYALTMTEPLMIRVS